MILVVTVFIPTPYKKGLVFFNKPLDDIEFTSVKSAIILYTDRRELKLANESFALNMDIWRLMADT